jgi:hypothetical protein
LRLPILLNPCAAALDQNDQHDDKQSGGNNADEVSTVHGEFLSFNESFEILSGLPVQVWWTAEAGLCQSGRMVPASEAQADRESAAGQPRRRS